MFNNKRKMKSAKIFKCSSLLRSRKRKYVSVLRFFLFSLSKTIEILFLLRKTIFQTKRPDCHVLYIVFFFITNR